MSDWRDGDWVDFYVTFGDLQWVPIMRNCGKPQTIIVFELIGRIFRLFRCGAIQDLWVKRLIDDGFVWMRPPIRDMATPLLANRRVIVEPDHLVVDLSQGVQRLRRQPGDAWWVDPMVAEGEVVVLTDNELNLHQVSYDALDEAAAEERLLGARFRVELAASARRSEAA